jgi:octaprenyl-diphosphate synthase
LKSGYLNSFGAFACEGLSRQQINQVIRSKDLESFYNGIGGREVFDQKLKSFDETNEKLIRLYFHHMERLKTHLKPGEEKLLTYLSPLTDLLYWRKKS